MRVAEERVEVSAADRVDLRLHEAKIGIAVRLGLLPESFNDARKVLLHPGPGSLPQFPEQ